MLTKIIDWSIRNRLLVLLGAAFLSLAGVYAVQQVPVDASPTFKSSFTRNTRDKLRKSWRIRSPIP